MVYNKLDSAGNKMDEVIGGYGEDWISTSHADVAGMSTLLVLLDMTQKLYWRKITQTYQGFIANIAAMEI